MTDIFHPVPTDLDLNYWRAVKACGRGEATPHQQQIVLELVIKKLGRADDLQSFILGSPDGNAFIQGRAWVGKTLQYILAAEMPEE